MQADSPVEAKEFEPKESHILLWNRRPLPPCHPHQRTGLRAARRRFMPVMSECAYEVNAVHTASHRQAVSAGDKPQPSVGACD